MDKCFIYHGTGLSYFSLLMLISLLSVMQLAPLYASDLGLTQEDCRCCHGTTLADRHHLLVNSSGRECLSCHPLTYNTTTLSYDLTVTRDCPQCHVGSLADRHHLLVDQVNFDCFTCHNVAWNPDLLQYEAVFNMACQTNTQQTLSGTITGTITDANGTGIGWVKVSTADGSYTTLATEAGSYQLPDMAPGSYTLLATLEGYAGGSQSVTVTAGEILPANFILTTLPLPATVSGVVLDVNQAPVEGASISTADKIHSALSAQDGSYNLGNVAAGSMDLSTVKEGYSPVSQPISVTAGQNLALDIVLSVSQESCSDNIDNDSNGLTDCDDPACTTTASCLTPAVETCGDGADNDNNGLADCDDPACIGIGSCESPVAEICDDSIDNNGDTLLDCEDPLCSTATNCLPEKCRDGTDNNGDGLVDCADPTCINTRACRRPPVEICDDNRDNDEDEHSDCDDPKCSSFVHCRPHHTDEICDNETDDNGDGAIDCADAECRFRKVCLDEICKDASSEIDCNNPMCSRYSACQTQGTAGSSLEFSAKASNEKENYEADNVSDDDPGTRWWVDENRRQWLKLDLGAKYPVNRVDIHWHTLHAQKYKIRVSRNNRYWKTVKSVENGTGGLESISFTNRKARYILIECLDAATSGFSIHDVSVIRGDPIHNGH